jgi:hypothetical protein
MHFQSILNRIENYKGFVYQRVRWPSRGGRPSLRVEARAWSGSRGRCSGSHVQVAASVPGLLPIFQTNG